LIYHRVRAVADPLFPDEVDADRFEQQMKALSRCCAVVPLDEAIVRLKKNSLPAAAAAITFDDGYADNHQIALPILERYRLRATFFVSSGFLNGGRMWNDTVIEALRTAKGDTLDLAELGRYDISTPGQRGKAALILLTKLKHLDFSARTKAVDKIAAIVAERLPDDLMMTHSQVRELHTAGMSIGAHTVNHPILARIDGARARCEMSESREHLQDIIRAPVALFAYPNGKPRDDYRAEHVALAKQLGFSAAFSTAPGAAHRASDLFQLPRFTPWDKASSRFMLRLIQNSLRARAETV
jgi:peptidoglycan/xylan/chitin deacetylase (PgdA/CDA1 family)